MQFYINAYANVAQESQLNIDILVLYKIRKNFQRIEDALKPYAEMVSEIISRNNGDRNIKRSNEDINKLGEQEVEVDIETISISEFGNLKTSPAFVNSIFFMLED